MHTWVDIATLTKKRNAQGRFVARCQANLLLCLKPGLEVAFVPPELDAPRRALITDVTKTNDTTVDITFDYFNGPWDSSQEEEIVGCHFLVKRDELDENALAEETSALQGYEVIDCAAGLVGVVQDELHNPGQSLLVVTKMGDGSDEAEGASGADRTNRPSGADRSELLIPFVDEIVKDIDQENRKVRVNLPVGLLDL